MGRIILMSASTSCFLPHRSEEFPQVGVISAPRTQASHPLPSPSHPLLYRFVWDAGVLGPTKRPEEDQLSELQDSKAVAFCSLQIYSQITTVSPISSP